jgi:catalase (peroxidase I)
MRSSSLITAHTQGEREDSLPRFVHDFVAAWDKVMNFDRFDLT